MESSYDPSQEASHASRGLPQLKDIYDLVQNRLGIVLSAAFGLTPNLFINVLQQKTDNTKA
jgi:hypothetical protein